MKSLVAAALPFAGYAIVACATPQPKETPAPTTTLSAATAAAPMPSASTSVVASASVTASASAEVPPPPPPPLSTEKWTALSTAKKTIALRYPADIFPKTKVAAESITLLSNLTRQGLADNTAKDYWRYQIQVDLLAGTPFDQVKKLFKAYPFPQMFPKATEASYVEDPSGSRTTVGGHAGYRIWTGVEGYNQETNLLALDDKKTLRFRCTYVGSVMGPEIDDEKQVAICNAVLASLFPAKTN